MSLASPAHIQEVLDHTFDLCDMTRCVPSYAFFARNGPCIIETEALSKLGLSHNGIVNMNSVNSGKLLAVLREGCTSWPHICTVT